MATHFGCAARERTSASLSYVQLSHSSGCQPTAAYTKGYFSASAMAARLEAASQPGSIIQSTPSAGIEASSASRSALNCSAS